MKGVPIKNADDKRTGGFPIVAIGASAGGIESFTDLFQHIPEATGMAYVFIQHTSPDHNSKLIEVLGRTTRIPVLEAKDKLKVKPDTIYVIPPNREIKVEDGILVLSVSPSRPLNHSPINHFFISLSEHYKEKAIGVLLSGNAPDGTLGLKAIKAEGGISFVQDTSAQFQGMARNAIAEEAVDLVLSPKRMAEELTKLSKQHEVYQRELLKLSEESIGDSDENLLNILKQIHRLTGVDFSHYKINTIKRRIVRRMILHKIDSLEAYTHHLKHHANEIQQLYQDLLINVTSFFRDEEANEYLRKYILARLTKQKPTDEPIRLWVPACSTGQEAYSIAMLLMEVLGEKAATTSVQIFATDLSEVAVNKARLGIYSKDEVEMIPLKRLNRFFVKVDSQYRIVKSIRDLCVFANHNVLKDPPFSRLDIVSCCNLLIYLEASLQKKLISTFHYALNNNGFLVLGKSETIGNSGYLFSQVDKRFKIYAKKKDAAAKAMFELSLRNEEKNNETFGRRPPPIQTKSEDLNLDKVVDQVLLKKYTPSCVVVSQDLDIILFRGSTGLFLEPAPGKASLNLMKMARPGLGFELRNLVYKAAKSSEPEKKVWTEVQKENKTKQITIEAIPLKDDNNGLEKNFLVVFDETETAVQEVLADGAKDKRVRQLETELARLREDMRTIIEEQEAANEELQSVNEEIVSSNEELQSINEELETSKEELESSNEELLTINQELQMRNEQLAEIQEYSEAIFTTIRESLLILDKNFRIKNANSCFYKTFQVTEEETEGKLLYELGNKQWNIPRLKELLEEIIPRNSQVVDFEVVHRFPHIGEKIMLVNARRLVRKLHSEHLVLLAIEDITQYRQAQRIIAEREAWFHSMADNSPVMVWVADEEKKIQFVNKAFLEFREIPLEEAIGKDWIEEMEASDEKKVRKVMDDAFQKKKEFSVQYHVKKEGEMITLMSKGNPNYSHDGTFIGFIGSCVQLPQ
ncbi:MAG TPA: CheR family methyltransferase [Flavisolibacter sp.]|jgi:two-component system CheB/CheR fusion protein|nr:CheR family methyltransferase [Flavisolibacter sp.]